MAEMDLVFRGIDADECTAFIREVHRRAQKEGKLLDFTWMASLVIPAFEGPALIWFSRQGRETQTDWALLRQALVDYYCKDRIPSAPSVATANTADSMPSPTVSPSSRLNLIRGTDQPRFHIRVVAPAYSGYIAKALPSTDVTLTSDPGAAQEWLEINERIDEFATRPAGIHTSNSVKGSLHEFIIARRSRQHSDGRLCSRLTFARLNIANGRSSYPIDGVPSSWNDNDVQYRWTINRVGRILLNGSEDHQIVMEKVQDGSLVLNIWTQRVWTEDDDAYVAVASLPRPSGLTRRIDREIARVDGCRGPKTSV